MFKFIAGVILGFIIAIGYLALSFKFGFDHQLTSNIVIAMATVTATAIHFDSVQKQRRDRVWEINKDSLINLSHAVADAIEMSSKFSDLEFNEMQNIPDNTCIEGSKEVSDKFQKTISNSLNVYKPLLNSNLIEAIEKYQESEQRIAKSFDYDEINVFEAYDHQFAAQKELQYTVNKFIKSVSGI